MGRPKKERADSTNSLARPFTAEERAEIPEYVMVQGELLAGVWQSEWPGSRLIRVEVSHG